MNTEEFYGNIMHLEGDRRDREKTEDYQRNCKNNTAKRRDRGKGLR